MFRIFRFVLALLASLIALLGLAGGVSAQKRVAFVVGTDKYDNLDKTRQLQRAVNDARAVGAAFKALGFEVLAAENLTRGQFNALWQKFLDSLKAGDTAAIYYAGHGVEVEGLNFLLPRDIPDVKFGRQEQIKRESLSVAEILLDLRGRNPEITLVILDACRDNPLIPDEMRSAGTRGGGLAPLKGEPPKGTFIMYSAGAGESALDRLPGNDPDQINSIFTRKLVPLLGTKGLALHDMARQLRVEVIELASTVPHSQQPAYYDGVVGKYCLGGCEGATDVTKPAGPSTASHRLSDAAEAWTLIKDTTNISELEAFVRRFGDTFYGDLAKARLSELKQQADAAQQAMKKKSEDEARAKEEAERQRLALLQQDDERKRAEAEAARRPADAAGAMQTGSVFRDCLECPEMVVMPTGEFMMGLLDGDEGFGGGEGPRHKVTIAKPFAVGKFEVTFAEWEACAASGGCAANKNPNDQGWGRGRRPVINVSWYDAAQYAAWLSKTTGKTYRLLTEAEWEYAARGVTKASAPHPPFATGAMISTDQANYNGEDTTRAKEYGMKGVNRGKTVEVGSFPGNAFGLHDMHGNVQEWVKDCWKDSYAGAPADGSAVTFADCVIRVLRSGSWDFGSWFQRSALRNFTHFSFRSSSYGFRVARTL